MLSVQWNSLQPGDRVAVHDDSERSSPLRDGVVHIVDRADGGLDIAIRVVDASGDLHIEHPPRLAVHLDPLGHDEQCWRCRLDNDGNISPKGKAIGRG